MRFITIISHDNFTAQPYYQDSMLPRQYIVKSICFPSNKSVVGICEYYANSTGTAKKANFNLKSEITYCKTNST